MKDAATTVFAFEKKNRAPIFDRDTENLMGLLNANSYQKGAWVLHMLRLSLGDDAFFRGIRGYYESHKNATASTEICAQLLRNRPAVTCTHSSRAGYMTAAIRSMS